MTGSESLRVCVYVPMVVYADDTTLTTDGTFQLMLPAFRPRFSSLDVRVSVVRDGRLTGRERFPTDGIGVDPLPAYNTGMQLLKCMPALLLEAWRTYRQLGRRWDLVWIVDAEPSQQLLFWLCRLGRKPAVLYLRGREDIGYGLRRRRFPLNWLATVYAHYQRRMLPLLVRQANLMVTGRELSALYAPYARRCHEYVSSLVHESDVEPDLAEQRFTRNPDPITLLSVGRLAPVKGLHVLLDALSRLRRFGLDRQIHLRVVAHNRVPDYVAELTRLITQHHLEECVTFVSDLQVGPALANEYRCADVFVCPSIQEGTPKTVPEAMSKALPIVASRVGGIPALVGDGQDGILVPAGDPTSLADALARLIRDPQLRRAMGHHSAERAREYVLEHQAARAAEFFATTAAATGTHRWA